MDCSTLDLSVLHYLPEFAQIHVRWVSDAIQPSYPLFHLLLLPSVFPSIRVFPTSGSQSIRALAPVNIQCWLVAAAAAKLLQSCPTLCDPIDSSPLGFLCPWDSPGKNTGVGCHFLLQCMKVKSESEVTQSFLTLSNPMDCSLPGSSVHGIFQARVLEWVAIAFSIDWLISLQSKGLSRVFSSSTIWMHQLILQCLSFFMVQLSHPYRTTGETIALTRQTFVSKVMSLLFSTLSRFVIAFLPRSKHLLISWLQSLSTVILEPKKIKTCHRFHFSFIHLPWSDGTRCHHLSFLNGEFQASLFTLLFHPHQEAL